MFSRFVADRCWGAHLAAAPCVGCKRPGSRSARWRPGRSACHAARYQGDRLSLYQHRLPHLQPLRARGASSHHRVWRRKAFCSDWSTRTPPICGRDPPAHGRVCVRGAPRRSVIPRHALVTVAAATVTPEAAVFAGGRLVYHGRIDDRYVDLGLERPSPTKRDLADALAAVLAGKPVAAPRHKRSAVSSRTSSDEQSNLLYRSPRRAGKTEEQSSDAASRLRRRLRKPRRLPPPSPTRKTSRRSRRSLRHVPSPGRLRAVQPPDLRRGEAARRADRRGDKNRFMPPWKADPPNGPFVGQHPLSRREIATIAARLGRTAARPKATRERSRPFRPAALDRRLAARNAGSGRHAPRAVHAAGGRHRRLPHLRDSAASRAARFVRGLEFRPGNPRSCTTPTSASIARRRRGASTTQDPAPGYSGLIARSATYPDGHFLGWTPGQVAPLLPKGLAWRSTGDRSRRRAPHAAERQGGGGRAVGRARTSATIRRRGRRRCCGSAGRASTSRPATAHYTITDSYVLPVDVEVQAVQPHAHYRAREIRGEATLPDGRKPLIDIKDWDFRWQHVYRYVTPLRLPKGHDVVDAVHVRQLGRQPAQSRAAARARALGQRSADEMGDLWIQVLTRDEPDLDILNRDFRAEGGGRRRDRLRNRDSRASGRCALHDDAALLYLELGTSGRGDRSLQVVARAQTRVGSGSLQPGHGADRGPPTRRGGGGVSGRHSTGRRLRERPQQPRKRASRATKDDDAIREFEDYTRLQPNSVAGFRNLAAAYAAAGRFDRAAAAADAALLLSPTEPLATEIRRQRDQYLQRQRLKLF